MECVKKIIKKLFSVDYRALALFRISVGLVLFIDLLFRLSEVYSLYSDSGVLPRSFFLYLYTNESLISAHLISGSWIVTGLLILVQIYFSITLIIGHRTRLSTFLSWILLISLHLRNPLVNNGGDFVMRAILLWGIFLPWGNYLSLDSLKSKAKKITKSYALSFATAGILLQGACVYYFSGILKNGEAWQLTHKAIEYALHQQQFSSALGQWLLQFPKLLEVLTIFTINLEIVAPLLLFIPIFTAQFRIVIFALFMILQVGINLSMANLMIFGYITTILLIPFLPSSFFDWVSRSFRKLGKIGLEIYYDGECGICKRIVIFLNSVLLLNRSTKISPSSVNPEVLDLMNKENSWIVRDKDGNTFTHFEAIAVVLRHSPVFFWISPFLKIPGVSKIGKISYQRFAQNRAHTCVVESPSTCTVVCDKIKKYALQVGASLLIIYMITSNVYSTNTAKYDFLSPKIIRENIAYVFSLNQNWGMFAPDPAISNGWFRVIGTRSDDVEFDLFTGEAGVAHKTPTLDKPASISAISNGRWTHYFAKLRSDRYATFRQPYAYYLCKKWHENYPNEDLVKLDFQFIYEISDKEFSSTTVDQYTYYNYECPEIGEK